MGDLRQRSVAVVRSMVLPALVVPVLVMALVVPLLPGGYSWQRWLLGIPMVVWFLYGGVQPLVWWWGADLVVGADGLRFGTLRHRSRPAQVSFAARNPYLVPWSALSDVRLVRDRSDVRDMCRAARGGSGPPQPTTYLGYFPARRRAALAFTVDLAQVRVPEVRPPSSRRRRVPGGGEKGVLMAAGTTWVFPVRDVPALLDALSGHGVQPVEATGAQPPARAPGRAAGPDDPFVIDTLTRNLGRPPTAEEIAALRRDWYDTDRFPPRAD